MENLSSRNVPKMVNQTITSDVEKVGKAVLDAAFKVHTVLGPGLLESVYEATLTYEIRKSGLAVANQLPVPIVYDGKIWMLVFGWICWLKIASLWSLRR